MKHEKASYADPALNYEVVTTGDAPSSIEATINAKGEAQISVKLYFATPDEAFEEGPERIAAIVGQLEMRLNEMGYQIAGHTWRIPAGKEGK